ncbi:probable 3-deoxy-D-manno-octulosonic acid transferase, mitochondrial isoform X2 [Nymphaea colorata]|uniref:probable 3-deoxy-D-manno-octulosonic acid transferase, mitochondrial isoform X2 n=1 Tax=Nymphaea colorata TaxID=210225 RepID=UPI00129EA5A7|nr:probable 3-deoxy-D-manno-octulosonic acid transferase, mitochondrial isoform X2 [Nymphaea colorata]
MRISKQRNMSRGKMTGWQSKGRVISVVYRAVTYALTPLIFLHVSVRRLRGVEHPTRWTERFGYPSSLRPDGPLLWFHAVSLGEGMAVLPVIRHCVHHHPHLNVLMTTTTTSAFNVIKDRLPECVIYQYAPLDIPMAVEPFLDYWKPDAAFFIESELWPNLILATSRRRVSLALLNARMSIKSFKLWSNIAVKPLMSSILSRFSLISPLSTNEAIHFQLLGASPFIINFAGDLKYVGDSDIPSQQNVNMENLESSLASRKVWMASSIHKDEEAVILWIHKELAKTYSSLLTIIVPRHPQQGQQITEAVQREGVNVALRSQSKAVLPSANFYVVDTLGELKSLYRLSPIAVVGGSFIQGLSGHNMCEAAAAGCAVLTGPHVGHFSQMVQEMQRLEPLSVQQVAGKIELLDHLRKLLSDAKTLEDHRIAAKKAAFGLSRGVVQNVWNLIDIHVLKKHVQERDM